MRRVFAIALGLGAVAALVWLLFFRHGSDAAAGSSAAGKKGKRGGDEGPVPVAIAEVGAKDVPIYLDGLGTVQAFNTVTVRPQIDGQLISVAFREGQDVRAGDLLAQIDSRSVEAQLQQAQAKKAQDESLLNTARRDLERYAGLVADGYVSKQQVDTQRQAVTQAEATIKADEGGIKNARVSLGYARITSPINGITGLRLVDVGNLVTAASTAGLVVVTQIKPISVVFTLPEQALAEIRAADAQPLAVIALDRDNRKQLAQGELTVIDNAIDQTTGTIKIKATFANEDKALWPGQFVNVRLLVRTQKNGVVIPSAAVQRGPNGEFVYVITAAQTAEQRSITVARSDDGAALITQGLKLGEKIVTDGQYRLQPGSKVVPAGSAQKPVNDAPSARLAAPP